MHSKLRIAIFHRQLQCFYEESVLNLTFKYLWHELNINSIWKSEWKMKMMISNILFYSVFSLAHEYLPVKWGSRLLGWQDKPVLKKQKQTEIIVSFFPLYCNMLQMINRRACIINWRQGVMTRLTRLCYMYSNGVLLFLKGKVLRLHIF